MLNFLPQTGPTPEAEMPEATGTSSNTSPRRPEIRRARAARVYLILSIVQVILGILELMAASVSVHFHSKDGDFPYYIGSFCIAAMLLMSSCLAFRVYNKGPLYIVCEEAKREVICAITWHRILSFLMFFGCVFGLAIIWMYGLCMMSGEECSYETHEMENKISSMISFVLGIVALFTAAAGLLLVQKFGPAFGIELNNGERNRLRFGGGFGGNVIDELRRQNEQMQRQLDLVNNTNMPPGLQGITNYGFEPPTPPPYSPTAVEFSLSSCVNSSTSHLPQQNTDATTSSPVSADPPKYSELEIGVLPCEPPPPYKETDDNPNPNSS
ncbi:hypothetical protein ACF0H5_006808 [Mactra antiquata]